MLYSFRTLLHFPKRLCCCAPLVQVKDKRKEIAQLRAEVKRMQAEMAAQQQQQQQQAGGDAAAGAAGSGEAAAPAPAAGSPLPPPRASARRGRDPAAEIEGLVEKISKLEHDIAQVGFVPVWLSIFTLCIVYAWQPGGALSPTACMPGSRMLRFSALALRCLNRPAGHSQ
jgi:hypothetical protein